MRLPECLHKRFLSIFVSRKLSGLCYYQNHDCGKLLWPCNFKRKCTFSVSPRRRQRRNMQRFETRLLKNAFPHRETNDSLGNGKFCCLLFCLVRCEGIWTLWLIQARSRSVCDVIGTVGERERHGYDWMLSCRCLSCLYNMITLVPKCAISIITKLWSCSFLCCEIQTQAMASLWAN